MGPLFPHDTRAWPGKSFKALLGSWVRHGFFLADFPMQLTPAGLEPAIPGSVGRCLIHWAWTLLLHTSFLRKFLGAGVA